MRSTQSRFRGAAVGAAAAVVLGLLAGAEARANPLTPLSWGWEWPKTDFTKKSVDLGEILSGGPPKDGIPSIDRPRFVPVAEEKDLAPSEPVVGLVIKGKARAYPLRILTWHEIVNDQLAGVPVTITYCPLCNSAVAFDRRVDGRVLDFGTTGKLRKSDMVMYDRQTESWWQQFLGEGIVGEMTGKRLKTIPTRLESFADFKKRAPHGEVMVPNDPNMRRYGANPYTGYDSASFPFLYRGELPKGINPMARVIVVDGEAWSMPLLRARGTITKGDLVLTWRPGQNSALDTRRISDGRDVGNVVVQRVAGGKAADVGYDVTFAFVYHAFFPDRKIRLD